jgi:protein SCO1/2
MRTDETPTAAPRTGAGPTLLLSLALFLAVPCASAQHVEAEHAKHASMGHGNVSPVSVMKQDMGHAHQGHESAEKERGGHDHASHDHSAHAKAPEKEVESAADIDLRNRTLVDQHGRKVEFVKDVIADRIVVMDFVFTTCTNVCPILSAVLAQVQRSLGDAVGDEVALVSLTVDPVRDTPRRLEAYASKHRAGPGWTWLTGPKSDVEDVLIGLGAYSVNFEDHPPMVVVGDPRTGQWSRFFGFPSPKRIVAYVEKLQAARRAAGS